MRHAPHCFTLLLAVLLAGCGTSPPGKDGPLLVLAAASTADAVEEVVVAFHEQDGTDVKVSDGSTAQLATQIAEGAPADLFLSASEKWSDYIRDNGLAAKSRPLLGNSLVLIVPPGNPAGVKTPDDLLSPRVKRVALAGPTVPAGSYARRALQKLGLLQPLEGQQKLTSGEDVRVALAYVERGEAEAGVVYSTDAKISDRAAVAYDFPADTHEPIRYPLVLLMPGQNKPAAVRLYEFLQSPRAAEVFRKHGFTALTVE